MNPRLSDDRCTCGGKVQGIHDEPGVWHHFDCGVFPPARPVAPPAGPTDKEKP